VLKLTSRYPDGIAGSALLLLRLSCAVSVFPVFAALWPQAGGARVVIASTFVAAILAAGVATRVAALALAISIAVALLAAHGERALLLVSAAGSTSALLLRGPGAYSIDAHRYGRRVIRLEPRSPDRGAAA